MCWAPGAQRDKYKTLLILRRLGRARKQIIECEHLISVTCDRHTGTVDSENLKQIFLEKVVAFCSLVIFYMISHGRYTTIVLSSYKAYKPQHWWERWLPQWCNGGTYILGVTHSWIKRKEFISGALNLARCLLLDSATSSSAAPHHCHWQQGTHNEDSFTLSEVLLWESTSIWPVSISCSLPQYCIFLKELRTQEGHT